MSNRLDFFNVFLCAVIDLLVESYGVVTKLKHLGKYFIKSYLE